MTRPSLFLVGLMSLTVASVALADSLPPKPTMAPRVPDYNLSTQVFDFPTGLRIMFQSDRSYPVVSVYSIVAHGSSDDPPDKKEVAHFVEHTWFRSIHGSLPPIMQVVSDLSGVFNASTWSDWTNYSTVAESQYLPILMRLESLRLTEFYAGVTPDVTTTEREVIRNEWRRRNENGNALLFDYANNVVYPDMHPYHATSTHDSITNITLDDIKAYVDAYYRPSETTVIVVGDVDPQAASSVIFENFDIKNLDPKLTPEMIVRYPRPGVAKADPANPKDWFMGACEPSTFVASTATKAGKCEPYKFVTAPRSPRVSPMASEPPPLGTKEVVTREAPVDNPIVLLAWSLPGGYRADHFELDTLGRFANGIVGNGLFQRYSSSEIGDTGCFVQTEVLASTMICLAEVKSKKVNKEEVLDTMLDQVSTLWSADELVHMQLNNALQNVKNVQIAGALFTLDNIVSVFGGRADTVGTYTHLTGSSEYYGDTINKLGQIDLGRMVSLASKYLKRDRAGRLIVNKLPDDDVDKSNSSSGYVGASQADDQIKSSDDLSRVTPDAIRAAYVHPDLSQATEARLSNGLRVVILPHGEAPMVNVSLVLGGGTLSEGKAITDLVQTFTNGAGVDPSTAASSMNYPVFNPQLYGLFTESGPAVSLPLAGTIGGTTARLAFSGPSGNLDSGLWILRDEVESMTPNMDGLGDWKKDFKDALIASWKSKDANIDWHINDMVTQHLYPSTPVRHNYSWADYQTILGYGAGSVTDYLKSHLYPANAVLLIVGNIDAKAALATAETMFGSWKGRSEGTAFLADAPPPAMPSEGTKVYLFDNERATQSQTNMYCRLNYGGHQDDGVVDVLGSIAGERVFTQLRVKEALSYTPGAFAAQSADRSAMLTFDSLALNVGVGRTIEYFMETAKALEAGDVRSEEVTMHQLRSSRQAGLGRQSVEQLAGSLSRAVANGDKDWSSITNYGGALADVTKARIASVMQGCSDHAIVVTSGPKDMIGAELDKLGIKYELVDWKARGDALYNAADPKGFAAYAKARAKAEAKKAKDAENKPEAPAPAAPTTPAP